MKAAVLKEFKEPVVIEDRERPQVAADDDVVIELEATGICRSDWHMWQGDWRWMIDDLPTDQILGHEPAGRVVETGSGVERFSEGDQVAVPFNIADGSCPMCYSDQSHLCENRVTPGFSPELPGAFAEEMRVPHADENLTLLPDGASPEGMAGLGCRFMTAYHGIVHRIDADVGESLAVHGCGGVGLSAVHIADAMGLDVVAVDINEEPLERARSLGADATVNAGEVEDVPGEVHDITDGGADYSVDALGIAETCTNSVLSLDVGGTHVQIGLTGEDEEGVVPVPVDIITGQELEFVGSKGMQPTRYDELVRMVEKGRLDPTKVITETVSLEDVPGVLESMTDFDHTGVSVVTDY